MIKIYIKIIRKIMIKLRPVHISILGVKFGKNIKIWGKIRIEGNPMNIKIGRNFSINYGTILEAGDKITIGNDVTISSYCQIHTSMLDVTSEIYNTDHIRKEVVIGNNVWLASNVIVAPGVKIGNNVIVGANSFINKDLESNSVFYGSPARPIKSSVL